MLQLACHQALNLSKTALALTTAVTVFESYACLAIVLVLHACFAEVACTNG